MAFYFFFGGGGGIMANLLTSFWLNGFLSLEIIITIIPEKIDKPGKREFKI